MKQPCFVSHPTQASREAHTQRQQEKQKQCCSAGNSDSRRCAWGKLCVGETPWFAPLRETHKGRSDRAESTSGNHYGSPSWVDPCRKPHVGRTGRGAPFSANLSCPAHAGTYLHWMPHVGPPCVGSPMSRTTGESSVRGILCGGNHVD